MAWYAYSKVWAVRGDIDPLELGRSLTGPFYAIEDTTFTTPLNVVVVATGLTQTTHSSSASGKFPDFLLERPSAVFKSGGFETIVTTTDPLPGATGPTGATGAQGPQGLPGESTVVGSIDGGNASTVFNLGQFSIDGGGASGV